jgi:hypothetical protein
MIKLHNIVYSQTYNLQRAKMDIKEVNKLEQAIEVHGYRGASKKKHNGVVNIKPNDIELLKAIEKYKLLEHELLDEAKNYVFFIDVKIVAHVMNGNRSIGSLYKNEHGELILYMLGFANYNYKLF